MASVLVLLLAGCKPTEKNYRSAYDAAKAKREAANAEAMIPATGLLSDDGPQMRIMEGDTLFIANDRLRRVPVNDSVPQLDTYNVAVGVYKMNTNARASAVRLEDKGYRAHAAQTTGDRWYTIAASFPTLGEAREFIRDFRADNPDYPYIGLPGAPVVVAR